MNKPILILGMLIALSGGSELFAGKIFGDIKFGDKPLPESVKVTITAPLVTGDSAKAKTAPAVVDSGFTDKFGAYSLKVKDDGKCILSVRYDKQVATLEVFSYKTATRYDLILEKKENKYTLKRK